MEWHDQGIVLSARKHGETSVIVELLTARRGRHLGVVRGGRSKQLRPVLQPGNKVLARWNARLSEHLGMVTLEPLRLRAAQIMERADALLALQSVCALLAALAEREPHDEFFLASDLLLEQLAVDELDWREAVVVWELRLLAELGYGLDLSCCAATGATDDLIYVSPNTGRAVSRAAGEPYKAKLLPLPGFLLGQQHAASGVGDLLAGLRLSGFFLERHLPLPGGLPEVRSRLIAQLERP